MNLKLLSLNETAGNGFTHEAIILSSDLAAQTAANTALTLNIVNPVNPGTTIKDVSAYLDTPFQNTADAGFNSTTFSVGDNSGVSTFLGATPIQINANGSSVVNSGPSSAVTYTAPNTLTVTFNSMSGKALSALNAGRLRILFRFTTLQSIAEGGI